MVWRREAARQWSEVERNRDDARRFSASEGKWSSVRSNLHSSAEAIARIWRDDWDNAKRACEEVVKRERHRDVERVLGKLASSRAGRAELRRKIDELLETMSDRVKDVQFQSGTSYVNAALESTRELEVGKPVVVFFVDNPKRRWLENEYDMLTSSRWSVGVIESVSDDSLRGRGWSAVIASDTARVIVEEKRQPRQ